MYYGQQYYERKTFVSGHWETSNKKCENKNKNVEAELVQW